MADASLLSALFVLICAESLVADGLPEPAATLDGGSSLRILHCDRDAFQARIDVIQRAQHTIDLAYYILNTDEAPTALLEMLRRASRRGVQVRLMVDGFKPCLPSGFEQYLRRQGIEITVYHKPRLCVPSWLNQRIHSKLIVVDSSQAIIGSRNLENGHFGMGRQHNYADCDILVAGDVAIDIKRYFDWLWRSCDVESSPPDDSITLDALKFRPRGRSKWEQAWRRADCDCDYQRLLNQSLHRAAACLGVTPCSTRDWMDGAVHGAQVCLLRDSRTDKSTRRFQRSLIRMIDRAQSSVLIETPYPAFDKQTRAAISRARGRGVCFTILTNSLETTNQLGTYAAYQNQKRSLLREGVHLREFCGDRTLHAKTMVVDQSQWLIGSHNFDARSNRANLELAVVSCDPAGAEQLRASIQARISSSTRIAPATIVPQVGADWTINRRARLILKRGVVEAYRCLL